MQWSDSGTASKLALIDAFPPDRTFDGPADSSDRLSVKGLIRRVNGRYVVPIASMWDWLTGEFGPIGSLMAMLGTMNFHCVNTPHQLGTVNNNSPRAHRYVLHLLSSFVERSAASPKNSYGIVNCGSKAHNC